MAAKEKLTKHYSDAGYDPGQRQDITVEFKKRKAKKVTLHVSFKAHSNGQDSYTYSQRRNTVYIRVFRIGDDGKTEKKPLKTCSWSYQCHGYCTSHSHSENFSFNAKYGETKFVITYENDRHGTNTPWYGPKSTGAVSETKLGTIKVDDAKIYDFKYHPGGVKRENVQNFPDDLTLYEGKDHTVSKKVPRHFITVSDNEKAKGLTYYEFTGWTAAKPKEGEVNTAEPKIFGGYVLVNIEANEHLYACWKPTTYTYRFYPTKEAALNRFDEWTDLQQKRQYKKGDKGIDVPDLNGTDKCKSGYKHLGWNHVYPDPNPAFHSLDVTDPDAPNHRVCRRNADVYSWPVYEARETDLIFNYGYLIGEGEEKQEYIRKYRYQIDTLFNFRSTCVDKDGKLVSPLLARPGYRLIGWNFNKPTRVYDTFEVFDSKGFLHPLPDLPYEYPYMWNAYTDIRKVDGFTEEEMTNGINLYAVWEQYAKVYVYTKGSWRLVLPYVYRIKYDSADWQSAYPLVYSNDDWRWSGNSKEKEEPEPDPPLPEDKEAYASFNSDTNVLTFFVDTKGKYENGQVEDDITYYTGIEDTSESIPWEDNKPDIKKVVFNDAIYPWTVANWFSGCESLEDIVEFELMNLSGCYDMREMCSGCTSLKTVNLSNVDATRVEFMDHAFAECTELEKVYFTSAKTALVISMAGLFQGCAKLESANLRLETNNLRDISFLFEGCESLVGTNLSTLDTSKVTTMESVFDGCKSMNMLTLGDMKTNEVTTMKAMFRNCSSIPMLDLTTFNTSKVTDMTSMFEGCSSLLEVRVTRTSKNTSKNYSGQFNRKSLPQTKDESTGVITYQNSDNMFLGCEKLVGRGTGTEKKEKVNKKKDDKSNYIEESPVTVTFKYDAEKLNATYAQVAWVFEDEKKVNKLNKKGEAIIDHYKVTVYKEVTKKVTNTTTDDKGVETTTTSTEKVKEVVETKEFAKDKKDKADKYAKEWNDKKKYSAKVSKVHKKLVSNTITGNEGYFREK